jgi:hypothetical protein
MDEKLFGDLVESMQQHNEIMAGTRKAARATKVDAQLIIVLRAKANRRPKRTNHCTSRINSLIFNKLRVNW